jgi:small membrane protein
MMIIQYLGIIFGSFALSRVFLRWKDKSISSKELFFWCIVWGTVVGVSAFPGIFTWLSFFLGIGRGVDILLYTGMIVIFYLMFRLYVKMESQQRDITKMVRQISINNASEKEDKSKKKVKMYKEK